MTNFSELGNFLIKKDFKLCDIELIELFIQFLKEPNIRDESRKRFIELIGDSDVGDWLESIIKLDIDEFVKFKSLTIHSSIIPYITGNEESHAYKYLIRILRDIKLEKLGI